MRVIALIHILILSGGVFAHEPRDGDIYSSYGMFTYMTHRYFHPGKAPVLVGPALAGEGDLGPHGGIELAMYYMRNGFTLGGQGRTVTEEVKRMYISTGYRYWITPAYSIALAFSSSYTMGDPYVVHDEYSAGARPRTSARDIAEYGADLSFQHEPWRRGRWSIVMDARYAFSFTRKAGEDADHFGVFVGLKYFLQSREKRPVEDL